ncbi:MAG: class I SAM-dependent methyltransferase [Brevinematales bacterium]|jgi:ubiquinone/menaquinone biosynthesis C-methylase UbiE
MDINKISTGFNETAAKYDEQRKFFIPCFEDYYSIGASLLEKTGKTFKSILDLGAGTGLLTKYLFDRFPAAHFTLVDISDKMMELSRQRFEGLENFDYVISDYSRELPTGKFDLIASGLSIHHLEDDYKSRLYNALYNNLEGGGYLLNLDQFNAGSDMVNDLYKEFWLEYISKSGIDENEKALWLARRKLDRENTIDATKNMLRQAGFEIVECVYSYMKFGVIMAVK